MTQVAKYPKLIKVTVGQGTAIVALSCVAALMAPSYTGADYFILLIRGVEETLKVSSDEWPQVLKAFMQYHANQP